MTAFDAVFDFGAFDSNQPGPVLVGTGDVLASLAVSVGNPYVFQSGLGQVAWNVSLVIGETSFGHRLCNQLVITAAEDGARVASFDLVILSSAELVGIDQQSVTIDYAITAGGVTTTVRRFTGVVESVEINVGRRIASVSCRDGYQEIVRACRSPDAVEQLFSGMAYPARDVVAWNDAKPDASEYFLALLDTVPGCCAIDSGGQWRVIPWSIGVPDAIFGEADIIDQSLVVRRADRRYLPSSIKASLTHRFFRLHNIEIPIIWQGPSYLDQIVRGVSMAPKATVVGALEGLSGWHIKGKLEITQPTPGSHTVTWGGTDIMVGVSLEQAENCIEALAGTLYRRWYQEIEVIYEVVIPMGGTSPRDDIVSASISSTFDASAWEEPVPAEGGFGVWATNIPISTPVLTGYEALPAPWPAANTGTDYFGSPDSSSLSAAASHVVAKALRKAAQGRRKQSVSFQRVIDPRWEIGAVLSVSAYGVSATGQVVEFEDRLDFSSGDAVTNLVLACPDGNGSVTQSSVVFSASALSVSHAAGIHIFGNHYAGATDTVFVPEPADSIDGYLTNVSGVSSFYSMTAPTFNPQFRAVMGEISAGYRDPISRTVSMAATVSIAGSGISVSF